MKKTIFEHYKILNKKRLENKQPKEIKPAKTSFKDYEIEYIEKEIGRHKQMIETSNKFINIYNQALEDANDKELDYVEIRFRISTGARDLNGTIEYKDEIERKSTTDTIKLINALEEDCKKSMEIIKKLELELNKFKGGK